MKFIQKFISNSYKNVRNKQHVACCCSKAVYSIVQCSAFKQQQAKAAYSIHFHTHVAQNLCISFTAAVICCLPAFQQQQTQETLKMMTFRIICLILMSHWLLKGYSNSKMDQTWKCCQSAPSQKAKNNKVRCQVVDSTSNHRFRQYRIDFTVKSHCKLKF